jgi:hypothetical protein
MTRKYSAIRAAGDWECAHVVVPCFGACSEAHLGLPSLGRKSMQARCEDPIWVLMRSNAPKAPNLPARLTLCHSHLGTLGGLGIL